MNVLVIGGTGALGVPAVKALLAANHRVRATARSESSTRRVSELGAETVGVDVYDTAALTDAMKGCDAVVRLTTKIPQSVMEMRSKGAWDETNRLRTVSAQRIVDAAIAAGVHTYVTESFFAAYRSSGDAWVTEATPSDDGGLATMKAVLTNEQQAQRFAAGERRGVALRFGGFYAAENPATAQLIEMLRKRMLPLIGPANYYFPSLHLEDAAQAVVAALRVPSGTYNVCDDRPRTWGDFITGIAQVAGAPQPMHLPAFFGPVAMGYPWKWMSRSVRMSNELFKKTASWTPRYPDAMEALRAAI